MYAWFRRQASIAFAYVLHDGLPFHGDPKLLELIDRMLTEVKFKTFFETGTFRGDTLRYMMGKGLKCYSVESYTPFYLMAKARLGYKASIYHGNSANELQVLLPSLEEPILFWLDAHYMGEERFRRKENPLPEEIKAILMSGKRAYIMIDDYSDPNIARLVPLHNGVFKGRVDVAFIDMLRSGPRLLTPEQPDQHPQTV